MNENEEEAEQEFICEYANCELYLEEPITIPCCGRNVCRDHFLSDQEKQEIEMECQYCKHLIHRARSQIKCQEMVCFNCYDTRKDRANFTASTGQPDRFECKCCGIFYEIESDDLPHLNKNLNSLIMNNRHLTGLHLECKIHADLVQREVENFVEKCWTYPIKFLTEHFYHLKKELLDYENEIDEKIGKKMIKFDYKFLIEYNLEHNAESIGNRMDKNFIQNYLLLEEYHLNCILNLYTLKFDDSFHIRNELDQLADIKLKLRKPKLSDASLKKLLHSIKTLDFRLRSKFNDVKKKLLMNQYFYLDKAELHDYMKTPILYSLKQIDIRAEAFSTEFGKKHAILRDSFLNHYKLNKDQISVICLNDEYNDLLITGSGNICEPKSCCASNLILTSNNNYRLRVWNVRDKCLIKTLFSAHSNQITGIQIIYETNEFLTSSFDCTVKVWNLTSIDLKRIILFAWPVLSICLLQNERFVCLDLNGTFHHFFKYEKTFEMPNAHAIFPLTPKPSVVCTHNLLKLTCDKTKLISNDSTAANVNVWSSSDLKLLHTFANASNYAVSPDGSKLFLVYSFVDFDFNQIDIIDLMSEGLNRIYSTKCMPLYTYNRYVKRYEHFIKMIEAISNDLLVMVVSTYDYLDETAPSTNLTDFYFVDKTVLFDLIGNKVLVEFPNDHRTKINCMALSKMNGLILTGSDDEHVVIRKI